MDSKTNKNNLNDEYTVLARKYRPKDFNHLTVYLTHFHSSISLNDIKQICFHTGKGVPLPKISGCQNL